MKIGDKVRLLRGTEEGRIVNIRKNKFVDIEIEDGFVIPALINEVVVVSQAESASFNLPEPEKKPLKSMEIPDPIGEGLFLAFAPADNKQFNAYFINHTQHTVLYVISQYDKKSVTGKKYGICQAGQFEEIGMFTESIMNQKYQLNVQIINYEVHAVLKSVPIDKNIALDKQQLANKIYWNEAGGEVALVGITGRSAIKIDAEALKQSLYERHEKPSKKAESHAGREITIDLHTDPEKSNVPANEILSYQLNQFEKAYDEALLNNASSLKIIHGAGAGILRKEIHKRLSARSELKYFEDADKERFGFGATVIYF